MTAPPACVRPAEPADAAWIASLHHELFDDAWSEAAVATLLAARTSLALASEHQGGPAGFLLAQVAADEAEILSIGVATGVQRQGFAGALIEGLVERARTAGVAQLFLEVAEDNAAARALYSRHGFREAGRRRGYYVRDGGKRVDALLMRRSLLGAG